MSGNIRHYDDSNAYPIEYIIEYVKIHPRSIIKLNNELLEAFMVHHMNAALGHANANTQTMNSYDAIMEYFNEHIQRVPKAHEFREYMTARILANHYARILRQIPARGTRNARIFQTLCNGISAMDEIGETNDSMDPSVLV